MTEGAIDGDISDVFDTQPGPAGEVRRPVASEDVQARWITACSDVTETPPRALTL